MARPKRSLNRREALQQIGVIGIGAVVTACGSDNGGASPSATPTQPPTAGPSASQTAAAANTATAAPSTATPAATNTAAASTHTPSAAPTQTPTAPPTDIPTAPPFTSTPVPSCILTPQLTAGPFYIDVGLARADIRESQAGIRLALALQLVGADGCAPIRDAVVNVWQTDAAGRYSGFPNQPGGVDTTGQTFLRGFQVTDADGRVAFTTIYPGWYPGRTVHIHVRVHLDSTTVLVTQLYFSDSITDTVHAQAPYNQRGARDTTNASDAIAGGDLDELLLAVTAADDGYDSALVLGVASV